MALDTHLSVRLQPLLREPGVPWPPGARGKVRSHMLVTAVTAARASVVTYAILQVRHGGTTAATVLEVLLRRGMLAKPWDGCSRDERVETTPHCSGARLKGHDRQGAGGRYTPVVLGGEQV